MQRKRILRATLIAILTFMILSGLSTTQVQAHTPSGMTLGYDAETNELLVSVSHSVTDPDTHWIETITVFKNDVEAASRSYTNQDSSSGMSDTFTVDAEDGDVLKATGVCSISGFITREITVSITTTTTTTTTDETTTDEPFPVLLIATGIGAIIVVAIVVILFSRK